MRRWVALLLVLLTAITFAGCKQSRLDKNIGEAFSGLEKHQPAHSAADIDTFTEPDFSDTLHFNVTHYPDSDAYALLNIYVINVWFGQLEYHTNDGRMLVLRVAKSDSKPLRQSYNEGHFLEEKELAVGDVTLTSGAAEKGCTLSVWEKDGFQYSLHTNARYTRPSEKELRYFVETLRCKAA